MKKLVVVMLGVLVLASGFSLVANDNGDNAIRSAQFSWTMTSHDFGKIRQGVPAKATFSFINTGNEALTITSVKGSCGCTVADFTKGEISPGAKGEVTAVYNAKKMGVFNKTVTVNANTGDEAIVLKIKGEVVE
ncbi:MAG: DUF1573 domain-containing protein [Cyclobacteriaceae bacterium]